MARLDDRGPWNLRSSTAASRSGRRSHKTRHAGLIVLGLQRTDTGRRPGSTAYPVICAAPVPVLAVPVADTGC
jgi:hypothetical protein